MASQRDGPLLLRVVDDLAQAALKARNDFLAELNSADAQRREINAAAKARLEAELGQMAQTAAKLSDRLFYATRGIINLPVRECLGAQGLGWRAPTRVLTCAHAVLLAGAAGRRDWVPAADRGRAADRIRRGRAAAARPAAGRGSRRASSVGIRRRSRGCVRQLEAGAHYRRAAQRNCAAARREDSVARA